MLPSQNTALVTHARVVVHLLEGSPFFSENHWSIYLLLQDGSSVRINMMADDGETTGKLEWSEHSYQDPHSALSHWDYAIIGTEVTVRKVHDLVYEHGRDRYQFEEGGFGCRYWCHTIMSDLETSTWVAEGSQADVRMHMQYRYSKSHPPIAVTWVEGTFG